MKKVAIIGAGLSGLTLAQQIADIAEVTIFEKFNQVSGRMAAREHLPYVFDHGAQFFTVKHPEFADFVHSLKEANVVASWEARFVEVDGTQVKKSRGWEASYPHYVGVPNMASVGVYLSAQLLQQSVDIRLNTHVTGMHRRDNQWCLTAENDKELGCYDWVVTAIPAAQTAELMPNRFRHQHTIHQIQMLPCYALMLGYAQPLELPWDAAHVTNSVLSWISVNSSKPARHSSTSLVAMSRNMWASEHFNHEDTWVKAKLMDALVSMMGEQAKQPQLVALKKWHFANAPKSENEDVLIDTHQQLASCGDWCISGRVESAFMSALQLSKEIRKALLHTIDEDHLLTKHIN